MWLSCAIPHYPIGGDVCPCGSEVQEPGRSSLGNGRGRGRRFGQAPPTQWGGSVGDQSEEQGHFQQCHYQSHVRLTGWWVDEHEHTCTCTCTYMYMNVVVYLICRIYMYVCMYVYTCTCTNFTYSCVFTVWKKLGPDRPFTILWLAFYQCISVLGQRWQPQSGIFAIITIVESTISTCIYGPHVQSQQVL